MYFYTAGLLMSKGIKRTDSGKCYVNLALKNIKGNGKKYFTYWINSDKVEELWQKMPLNTILMLSGEITTYKASDGSFKEKNLVNQFQVISQPEVDEYFDLDKEENFGMKSTATIKPEALKVVDQVENKETDKDIEWIKNLEY